MGAFFGPFIIIKGGGGGSWALLLGPLVLATEARTKKQGKKDPPKEKVPEHPPPPYMCEIGTMWQIGVLTGKPCTFLVQNGSFSTLWHYKNKERFLKGSDVKCHIPSTCLDASKEGFSTVICSINRVSEWLWLENPTNPSKMAKMCPVSR